MWPFKKKTQESSKASPDTVKVGFVYSSTTGDFYFIRRRDDRLESFKDNLYIGFVVSIGTFNVNSFEPRYFSCSGLHRNACGSLKLPPDFLNLETGIPYEVFKEIASTIIDQSLKQEPMQMTVSIKPHLELMAEINGRIDTLNYYLGELYGLVDPPALQRAQISFYEIRNKSRKLERMLRSVPETSPALKLEVGKVYENARGDRILISLFDINDHTFKGICLCQKNKGVAYWFNANGAIYAENNVKDFGDIVKLSKNQSREIIL